MKKILIIFFIICLYSIYNINVNAKTIPTLEQIANKFNNHSTVIEYGSMGTVWKATANNNKIIITTNENNITDTKEYTLDNNILSLEINDLTGSVITNVLIDCVEQLHGYPEGEIGPTLQSEKITDYTLEKEGLEIKQNSDGESTVKIDISKKIPLLDFSKEYIEVEDLDFFKEYISGDGSAETKKGYIYINKSGYDGENTVLVAEKNKLTDNSYKSILSVIEVMFDSKEAVNYFKNNYSSISSNKEFVGFKIEINPNKTDFEKSIIPDNSGYKFLRITINKDKVNEEIKNKNNDNKKLMTTNYSKVNLIIIILLLFAINLLF